MMFSSRAGSSLRQLLLRQCRIATSAGRGFSSHPQRIQQLPPNLKIDPKSMSSPFAGAQRIRKTKPAAPAPEPSSVVAEAEDANEDGVEAKDETITANEEAEEEEEDYDDDDDDDDAVLYDLSTKPAPLRVIPLPDRLHVPILDKLDLQTTVGTLPLSPVVFGQDPVRVDLIHRVVIYQRNKKRGKRKAKTKTISEVRGSGRKMRPQKGGGVARAGHKRPPHWRGGAKAHGPKGSIQDYTTKLNKHTKRLGMVHVLSQKLKEQNLMVVNDWNLDSFKTKELARILNAVNISGRHGKSAYLLDWIPEENDQEDSSEETGKKVATYQSLPVHLTVAVGNLPHVKVSAQNYANVYDILKHEKLIVSLGAIRGLEERLGDVTY